MFQPLLELKRCVLAILCSVEDDASVFDFLQVQSSFRRSSSDFRPCNALKVSKLLRNGLNTYFFMPARSTSPGGSLSGIFLRLGGTYWNIPSTTLQTPSTNFAWAPRSHTCHTALASGRKNRRARWNSAVQSGRAGPNPLALLPPWTIASGCLDMQRAYWRWRCVTISLIAASKWGYIPILGIDINTEIWVEDRRHGPFRSGLRCRTTDGDLLKLPTKCVTHYDQIHLQRTDLSNRLANAASKSSVDCSASSSILTFGLTLPSTFARSPLVHSANEATRSRVTSQVGGKRAASSSSWCLRIRRNHA